MGKIEIEQKYKIVDPNYMKRQLKFVGAKKAAARREYNEYFDLNHKLISHSSGLRLRHYGKKEGVLTFKGPRLKGKLKKRFEAEVNVDDWKSVREILKLLGYQTLLQYSKWREEYKLTNAIITLDQLPKLGWFLEIEGSPQEIRKIAKLLELKSSDLEYKTYPALVQQLSRSRA